MRLPRFVFGVMTILLAQASAADTKEQSAGAPVLGYAFGEESRQLRAILGVPGASSWSDPLALPDGVTSVRIANGHRWALTVSAAEMGVLLLDTLQYRKLEGFDGAAYDAVTFSPGGSAVAIRKGDSVTVFAGLPDAANKIGTFEAAQLVVSDAGEVAMVKDGRILRASSGEFLSACTDCRISYFPNSDALVILEAGRLSELRGGELRAIASGFSNDLQQVAAGLSRIVLAGKDQLLVLERKSGSITAEESLSGTDRIELMRLSGTWLLSAAEGSAAWLYSNDGVRFVPATRSKEQQ